MLSHALHIFLLMACSHWSLVVSPDSSQWRPPGKTRAPSALDHALSHPNLFSLSSTLVASSNDADRNAFITFSNVRAWALQSCYWLFSVLAGILSGSVSQLITSVADQIRCARSQPSLLALVTDCWRRGSRAELLLDLLCLFAVLGAAHAYGTACTRFMRRPNGFVLVVFTLCNSFADSALALACLSVGAHAHTFFMQALGFGVDSVWCVVGSFVAGYTCCCFFLSKRGAVLEPIFWPPHKKPCISGAPYVPWLIMTSFCACLSFHVFGRCLPYLCVNFFFSCLSAVVVCPSPPWGPNEVYPCQVFSR